MRHTLTSLVACMLACGCAGTSFHAAQLTQAGVIRLAEPENTSYTHRFYIRSARDYGTGYDTMNTSDRHLLIKGYLGASCTRIAIVSETFLPAGGKRLDGIEDGTYVCRVVCN